MWSTLRPIRMDPWQLDSSLFDVQEAQLNFDAFFWPSPTAVKGAYTAQTGGITR